MRKRGTIVVKKTCKGSIEVDISGLVVDEIRLVDPLPLIKARFPLQ
jgi:hypothetical protein